MHHLWRCYSAKLFHPLQVIDFPEGSPSQVGEEIPADAETKLDLDRLARFTTKSGELIELLDIQLFHAGAESDVHEDCALSARRTLEQQLAP